MASLRKRLGDPVNRLVALIAAIVVLFAFALGLTLWRYGAAIDQSRAALRESQIEVIVQQARTELARKGGLVDAYASDKDPVDLRDIAAADRAIAAELTKLQALSGGEPEELTV